MVFAITFCFDDDVRAPAADDDEDVLGIGILLRLRQMRLLLCVPQSTTSANGSRMSRLCS